MMVRIRQCYRAYETTTTISAYATDIKLHFNMYTAAYQTLDLFSSPVITL